MRTLLTLLFLLAFAAPAAAAPSLAKLGDFAQPTYAASPPADPSRVFVTERTGRVRLLVDGTLAPAPFLDLNAITQADYQERGLLSIAFAPDYAASGRFYVYLTVTGAASVSGTDGEVEVREYHRSAADPNAADPAGYRVILAVPHTEAKNHNGGQLQFGPDGRLYAGTGDGGGGNDQFHHSQDPHSLLGKLLRLDVNANAPEIVARGLRNPWRFSFDRATGQIIIGDVGQDNVEEIDVGFAANYGWPCREGTTPNVSDPGCAGGGTTDPFLTHTHRGDGFCSITGGYVVRDPGLPTLNGRYVYGDYCEGDLRSVGLANAASDAAIGINVPQLSSFGEDACGRILVVSLAGSVSRLVDGAPSPCAVAGGPPPDKRACRVNLRVTGIKSVRRRHFVSAALRSDESCKATVTAKIAHVAYFRAVKGKALVAGRRTVLKLKLSKHGLKAVRRSLRHHRRLRVAVRVRAVDGAGNVLTLARGVRISG
jgi:Glucose / Sorbosone dehydrogenase